MNPLDNRIKIKKIRSPKLGPNKKKTKRNVRDASRQQPSKRGKNNGQVPQARVLADNVLQPSTKLKADIVQTASDIKRQLLNFARKCKLTFASTISLFATNCQLSMRHEASDLPSFICHAANDDQPSIRKYAMNLNFVFSRVTSSRSKPRILKDSSASTETTQMHHEVWEQ